jgi:hypothetical protein
MKAGAREPIGRAAYDAVALPGIGVPVNDDRIGSVITIANAIASIRATRMLGYLSSDEPLVEAPRIVLPKGVVEYAL